MHENTTNIAKRFNSLETDFTIIELELICNDVCYNVYWHNFQADIMNHMENVTSKPLQATYLQMNDTHTTHWSDEYSVYMIGY